MAPKRKAKAANLLDFWQKQEKEQAKRQNLQQMKPDEVITISDSLSQDKVASDHPLPAPSTSTSYGSTDSTSIPPPAWAPLVRRSSSSLPQARQAPVPSCVSFTKPSDLIDWGLDREAAKSIRYPCSEIIRQYEISIVRSCLLLNSCVSLPNAQSSAHIIAVVFLNFLRWFRRSRCVYCCSSSEASLEMKERCITAGMPESQISIIDSFAALKKMAAENLGSVIISNPLCLIRAVETDNNFVSDIRCMAMAMDPGESPNKHKKIIASLVTKGIPFRIIVSVPSVPNTSLKTSPIQKRQQLITSLLISQWEEPNASDISFRSFGVPLGVEVQLWSHDDLDPTVKQMLNDWRESCQPVLSAIIPNIGLLAPPSAKLEDLLNFNWTETVKPSPIRDMETQKAVLNCQFLATAYRMLLLHGPRCFMLFCEGALNETGPRSHSEQLQMCIVNEPKLIATLEMARREYLYNTDSSCNATLNPKSLQSHSKFSKINERIKLMVSKAAVVTGVILCESSIVAQVIAESIDCCDVVYAVPPDIMIPTAYQQRCKSSNRLSGLFLQNSSLILVLPVNLPGAYNLLDTCSSNGLNFVMSTCRRSLSLLDNHGGDYIAWLSEEHEKLVRSCALSLRSREYDSRVTADLQRLLQKYGGRAGLLGSVNKYDFKFEASAIRLSVSSIPIVQTLTRGENMDKPGDCAINSASPTINAHRHGFELSSVEYADYRRLVGDTPLPKTGIFTRNGKWEEGSMFNLLSDTQVIWNDSRQYLGDVESSRLTFRMVEYMRVKEDENLLERHYKQKYSFEDHSNRARIAEIDSLLAKLDTVFLR